MESVTLEAHLKYLTEIGYELDLRDLYKFHVDIWVTKDKDDAVAIKDMSTGHIVNAIAMIDRNGPTCVYGLGPLYRIKLQKEFDKRIKEESMPC